MSAATSLLHVRDLNISFPTAAGRVHAVKNLSFTLDQGKTLALVGESGCGKSSTALALLGLMPPETLLDGRIEFDGKDLVALSPRELRALRGRALSMIFQEPMTSLNPVHTVGAQIAETLGLHLGLSAAAARRRTLELLDLVHIADPDRRIDDYPHQLSGGQRQRVMIAMAVACQPRLLVADEPTTALDVTIQAQILDLLDRLRRELSMALLLITHDLGVVSHYADNVVVMYGGELVEQAPTSVLFDRPVHPYTRGLLGASLHGNSGRHYTEGALAEIDAQVDSVTGKTEFRLRTPARTQTSIRPVQAAAALLSVRGLRSDYSGRHGVTHAVDGVDFDIAAGETVGLVGESGCGKSTLAKTLLRLVNPVDGHIVLSGNDVARTPERGLAPLRDQVQMIFQDPYASLNPRRRIVDILDRVLAVKGGTTRSQRRASIHDMLERVGLPVTAAARYPNEFSGGQRQRIGIARALILKPALVVCDEPVSALDVSVQAQILNLLIDLKRDFNLSYLFISHDLAVVRYIADRVLVMSAGKIVESGRPDDIWERPEHPYTRTLMASVQRETREPMAKAVNSD